MNFDYYCDDGGSGVGCSGWFQQQNSSDNSSRGKTVNAKHKQRQVEVFDKVINNMGSRYAFLVSLERVIKREVHLLSLPAQKPVKSQVLHGVLEG